MIPGYTPVHEFENYGVSMEGDVINFDTGRHLRPHLSQNGHVYVSLSRNGVLCPRVLARLVGYAYLPIPPEHFDTIIHHDYNLENNHAGNLSWRPGYFAVQYQRQGRMAGGAFRVNHPIVCVETGEVFPSSREAAMSYGVLEMDILTNLDSVSEVFPSGKCFASY